MSNKAGLFLIVGLVIGGGIGFVYKNTAHQRQIDEILSQLSELQAEHSALESSYSTKVNAYNQLSIQKNKLQNDYDELLSRYKSLSEDISDLDNLLDSYSYTTESFSRVFNKQELEKIGSIVQDITNDEEDTWYNYQKIWDYVNENIEYAYDIEIPLIGPYHYITIDGCTYYADFDIDKSQNYVQTPEFTLNFKQGDCEDQAILLYGMIKYYFRNIYGTVYNIYLTRMEFGNGDGHYAVFMPVKNGNICILDPAGNYATLRHGSLTQKTASLELTEYNKIWSEEGYISKIEIYWVDDVDGSYSVEAEGDLDTIINFFEKR